MPDKAVFLDRDNTIIANDGYLGDPTKVRLLPGAGAAIASLRRLGYRIIVASNQSGVARGMFDEAAVEAVNQEMIRQLREQAAAHVDASYYCPYHPEAVVPEYKVDHEWRKPKPGMLKAAAADFDLDLTRCWMIGDMLRDIAAGAAVHCRTILLGDPEMPPAAGNNEPIITPNFVVRSLADAARIIVREQNSPLADPVPLPVGASERMADIDEPGAAPAAQEMVSPASVNGPSAEEIASAIAERLRGEINQALSTPALKTAIEDLSHQLQNSRRHHDMAEFSMSLMLAVLLQGIVILLLGLSIWDLVSYFQIVAGKDTLYWLDQIQTLLWSTQWLTMGALLQGMVVALYLRHRAKSPT